MESPRHVGGESHDQKQTSELVLTGADLNEHDVLFGRGHGISGNPGNVKFRIILQERRQEYLAIRNKDWLNKNRVASEIANGVKSRGGRFLKKRPDSSKDCAVYELADEELTMEKVKQGLRQKRSAAHVTSTLKHIVAGHTQSSPEEESRVKSFPPAARATLSSIEETGVGPSTNMQARTSLSGNNYPRQPAHVSSSLNPEQNSFGLFVPPNAPSSFNTYHPVYMNSEPKEDNRGAAPMECATLLRDELDCVNSLYQLSKAGSDGASTDTFSVSAHSATDAASVGVSGGASHYSERSLGSSLPRRDTALPPGVANTSLGGGTNPSSFGFGCTSLDMSVDMPSFGGSTLAGRSKCEESRGTLSFGAKVEAMSLPSFSSAEVSEMDGRTQIPSAYHSSGQIPSAYHPYSSGPLSSAYQYSQAMELDGCRAPADELFRRIEKQKLATAQHMHMNELSQQLQYHREFAANATSMPLYPTPQDLINSRHEIEAVQHGLLNKNKTRKKKKKKSRPSLSAYYRETKGLGAEVHNDFFS
ncbi:hypothetical protein THAOC_31808 [Thalassiosira oceanica]|uniref:DUF6824 domain-containing protein n=1 Tax=Thalassiosira oceanica TaxID=159749 RepID=K0RKA2_THAOC|nr:hypothetical protein THAOC_31808 [Thalassiosira oceanica]|eukprot:EJK49326.1 hypothetical protein THAOC_31808 [Thalassiosira oceanica]